MMMPSPKRLRPAIYTARRVDTFTFEPIAPDSPLLAGGAATHRPT